MASGEHRPQPHRTILLWDQLGWSFRQRETDDRTTLADLRLILVEEWNAIPQLRVTRLVNCEHHLPATDLLRCNQFSIKRRGRVRGETNVCLDCFVIKVWMEWFVLLQRKCFSTVCYRERLFEVKPGIVDNLV